MKPALHRCRFTRSFLVHRADMALRRLPQSGKHQGSIKLVFFILVIQIAASSFAQPAAVAPTPPMGWNSYNSFGSAVHEKEVRANAEYMAKNLKRYGWQYIVVDFCWSYPNPPGSTVGNPFQSQLPDSSYIPWLSMDDYGRLMPDDKKHPSAANGKGFKELADYVHSLGLKFGIHIMRGIPRQAVWAKSKVMGTNGITADMIADTSSRCPWLNHMWGVDMKKEGAQEYYNSLANLYASWGVDYLKMDDASLRTYYEPEVAAVRKAIDQCGRQMVLSLSPGQQFKYSDHMVANANAYRISFDFWDNWSQLKKQFDHCKQWSAISGPGHWPDADMLQIGKVSKRGPVGPERFSRFTDDEQITHITLWSIFRSPLMIGANMPENSSFVTSLLTNQEIIDVDQKAINSRELSHTGDSTIIWVSEMPDTKNINVAFFNLNPEKYPVILKFDSLGLKGKVRVRDLWAKKELGVFDGEFKQMINAHGAGMFGLTPL